MQSTNQETKLQIFKALVTLSIPTIIRRNVGDTFAVCGYGHGGAAGSECHSSGQCNYDDYLACGQYLLGIGYCNTFYDF